MVREWIGDRPHVPWAAVNRSVRRIAILVHAVVPGDPRIQRESDALLAAGHEVDIFCLRDGGQAAREIDGALRIIRLPVKRVSYGFVGHLLEYVAFTALATWALAREHARRHYRLVQVATLPDFLIFAALPLKLLGVPVLLDLHEDMPAFFADRFARASPLLGPLRPLIGLAARVSAALAGALITVHEPLRQLSIARGVAPEKITVVMNSADPALFAPRPRSLRSAGERLRLVHHSSLQRIYGLEVALEALALLRDRPNVPLVTLDVYGDGPYASAIGASIARLALDDRVHMHGRVPMERLATLLAEADAGLVPSLPEPYLQYSLSTKLLEYIALGIPVIASDLATFRSHFTDDALRYVAAGDASALADAIVSLSHEPDAAAQRAAEAQRQAAAYAWPEQAARYLSVIDDLTAR
jgi:glycosyltransferase involved in cell wall biosynthesis